MGNICRSAAAEAVMKKFLENRGESASFHVDSAGIIGYPLPLFRGMWASPLAS